MAEKRIVYSEDRLRPYELDFVEQGIREATVARDDAQKKKWNKLKAMFEYYNATALRKEVLAPYIRANFRRLDRPTKIEIPELGVNPLFQEGSIIDADTANMVRRAKGRHSGLITAGRRYNPHFKAEAFDAVVERGGDSLARMFCVVPLVEMDFVDGYGPKAKATQFTKITVGPMGSKLRKPYDLSFGWLHWVLLHYRAPAAAPVLLAPRDPKVMKWAETEGGVQELYEVPNGVREGEPGVWFNENLTIVKLDIGVSHERGYDETDDNYEPSRRRLVSGRRAPHAFDGDDRAKLLQALRVDILDPETTNDTLAEIWPTF